MPINESDFLVCLLKRPDLDAERIIEKWNVFKSTRPCENVFHWTWDFVSYYTTYRCLIINNLQIHPIKVLSKEKIFNLLEAYGYTMIQLFAGSWSLSRTTPKESALIDFMNHIVLHDPICNICDQIQKIKDEIQNMYCILTLDILNELDHIKYIIADYLIPEIDILHN